MKRSILVLIVGLCAVASLISCGGSSGSNLPPSHLVNRVLASQGVTSATSFGGLAIVDGQNDTLPRVGRISAGSSPGLMAITPSRNMVVAFDASSNNVYAVDTTRESSMGTVQLPGPTSSMVVPTPAPTGYAAVPTASVNGYAFLGAVEVMNLSSGAITTTIGVTNAQTVISDATGSQLLVFSNDSDAVTVLFPGSAVPPVDTSCFNNPPNTVCAILTGFSRPVYGIMSGGTAYILNCGLQCGGSQPASVAVLDLASLTVTNTIPVDAATWALLEGSTLYVAGTSPLATNNACTGQTWGNPPQPTAATTCGRLDIINLSSMTVSPGIVITDGYHDRMDMSLNGQLFIGSYGCTNIGNVNYPSGEVRGCLTIYNTTTGAVVIPPDNGDVGGFQSFTSRYVEYVAEGGNLRVYDTTKDILLINDFITGGTIGVVGYVGDVKAIDFF
ncbi:MAG TPA: hypothetical protein VJ999_01150 [Candidatus Sulfotelmatobacter sp.]|nr:hypothetical protein [Candidatus Sulfotelmatobacter sp.]